MLDLLVLTSDKIRKYVDPERKGYKKTDSLVKYDIVLSTDFPFDVLFDYKDAVFDYFTNKYKVGLTIDFPSSIETLKSIVEREYDTSFQERVSIKAKEKFVFETLKLVGIYVTIWDTRGYRDFKPRNNSTYWWEAQ